MSNNIRNVSEAMEFRPLGSGAQELDVQDAVMEPAALPENATHAMLSVKTNDVLVGFNRDPAAGGAGILLAAKSVLFMNRTELAAARFIRSSANAVVSIEPGTFSA